jgi:hypothetical protein
MESWLEIERAWGSVVLFFMWSSPSLPTPFGKRQCCDLFYARFIAEYDRIVWWMCGTDKFVSENITKMPRARFNAYLVTRSESYVTKVTVPQPLGKYVRTISFESGEDLDTTIPTACTTRFLEMTSDQ